MAVLLGKIQYATITWSSQMSTSLGSEPHGGAAAALAATALRTSVLRTGAELRALAREWDELLDRMPRPSPFLSWDWIETWWEEFAQGSQLLVITARDAQGELVGVAPLHVVRRRLWGVATVRRLEFLGFRGSQICADHMDFLALPAARAAIVAALAAEAWRQPDWDAWELADLAEDSPVPQAWQAAGRSLASALDPGEVCYYIQLPATIEAFWDGIRERHKRTVANLGRDRRRLERRFQAHFGVVEDSQAVAATMAALADLHTAAHARQGETGNFARPAYRRFHDRLTARLAQRGGGMLYLARLECDQRPVAVLYGYCRAGILYFYQSGFDPAMTTDGVGRLLLAWVLEDAIARLHAREFDFLRGAEAYKTLWAPAARHTRHGRGWRPGVAGRLARLEWRAHRSLAPLRRWLGAPLRRRRHSEPA
jgi:CelD/BcsL family acetyltransferase involved in cellulose biosynthesis